MFQMWRDPQADTDAFRRSCGGGEAIQRCPSESARAQQGRERNYFGSQVCPK